MKQFRNVLELAKEFPDEESARRYFENLRWGNVISCPHCKQSDKKIYVYNNGKLYKCSSCLKQFTVKVGTIFEGSAIPLQKWLFAIYLEISHKKGMSSIKLGKDLGLTQKTAWFMLHRIRYALKHKSLFLDGVVEADERYYGGKEINRHENKKKGNNGHRDKTMVMGAIERQGNVIATVNSNKPPFIFVLENVKKGASLMTDESNYYRYLKTTYNHQTVTHSVKEYVRGEVHTQNLDNFWSHLKRGINGIQHSVSPKHLDRYVAEYCYKYNTRKLSDCERFVKVMGHLTGRLTYK